MPLRLLLGMVFAMLLCGSALADDFWDTPWFTDTETGHSNHDAHSGSDDSGVIFPTYSLSLQTHGAYFGSGNEFLLGGGQVSGLGGVRHNDDHSSNHPTYGVYPEIQHLFSSEVGFMGPMWGAPDDFAPVYGEVAREQEAKADHSSESTHQGNTGIINDSDWWDD